MESARKSRLITKLVMSTESKKIAAIAKEMEVEIPFLRPQYLSEDNVPIISVNKHAMEFFDKKGWRADIVVSLQATSPLIISEDIDACIQKMIDTDCDSVVSMKIVEDAHPWRMYKLQADKVLPFNEYTTEHSLCRQDRPSVYKFDGAVYVRKRKLLEEYNGKDFALGNDVRAVLIPGQRAVDINNCLELKFAEFLINQRKHE